MLGCWGFDRALDRMTLAKSPIDLSIHGYRTVFYALSLTGLTIAGGPEIPGWLPLVPLLFSLTLLFPSALGFLVSISLIAVCMVAWAWIGVSFGAVSTVFVGLAAAVGTMIPLSNAFRERATRLFLIADSLQTRNEELVSAVKAAERATRSKSEFLAHMSHEIRTPLNGVMGCLDLAKANLKEVEGWQETRSLIDIAHSSSQALLQIINDVLDFSKIEAGAMSVEMVPTDVAAVLRESCRLSAPLVEPKGIDLQLELEAPMCWVYVDPLRFRQIIMNLVGNAVKFTKEGAITLSCRIMNDDILEIYVRDTGIGIAKESIPKLFSSFTQAEESTSRKFGGTGLGLALVKQLSELMGGTVRVESEVGEGSTFFIELPWRPAVAPSRNDENDERDKLPSMNLLIAEDNTVNQMIIRRTLEKQGHTVTIVDTGLAAVEAVQSDMQFDAILMDCHMPVMDGIEATRTLRARGHRIPVVALTASATTDDRIRCLEAGMMSFLSKPFRQEDLTRALRQINDVGRQPVSVPPSIHHQRKDVA